jgi:tryptophan-rich sensory protein
MERAQQRTSTAGQTNARVSLARAAAPRRQGFLRSPAGLAVFALASLGAAALGGFITSRRKNKAWYRLLSKPAFTPPDRAFAIVWPVLYSLGALSAWRVAKTPAGPARSVALGLWSTQLAFNAAWSPLFFGQHLPRVALADLVLNYASLSAYAAYARKVDPKAAYLVTPYLGWLTFAGALNGSIVARNRGGFTGLVARLAG